MIDEMFNGLLCWGHIEDGEEDLEKFKQALEKLITEQVIGLDQPNDSKVALTILDENLRPKEVFNPNKIRNKLRASQRTKLKQLLYGGQTE